MEADIRRYFILLIFSIEVYIILTLQIRVGCRLQNSLQYSHAFLFIYIFICIQVCLILRCLVKFHCIKSVKLSWTIRMHSCIYAYIWVCIWMIFNIRINGRLGLVLNVAEHRGNFVSKMNRDLWTGCFSSVELLLLLWHFFFFFLK